MTTIFSPFGAQLERAPHKVQAITASGAATSIDLSLGRFVDLTLTASTAITFTNAKATDVLDEVILRITQGGVGAYEITFVANVAWDHGIALDLSTAVGAVDELYLSTIDGGTTWDAALIHVALSVPS